ncbi:MAG: hypothetical protein IRZ29_04905 [Thermoflavifilum sp.]|nr:hypothetical protein [Thermoflavifilum sp.]
MRRLLAIGCLQLYFLAFMEGHELLRLPLFVQHYVKHIHEDPQMNFWDFLALHYSGKMIYDADWQQDMQLPFKTIPPNDLCLNAISNIVTPLQGGNDDLFPPAFQYTIRLPQASKHLYPIPFVSEMLKPPRS